MLSGRNARRPGRPLARVLALLLLGLVAGLGADAAQAQTGKFTGHVLDEAGQPLVGATVFVVGTELGAAVDMNGEYVILRIPPGTFTVRVSSVGFQTQMIEGVRSISNQTTTLDVTLREETVEGEEITVLADRPVIDVAQTSSVATIGRDEIAVLPVQEIADIVNLQAGVVDGHFRGGRLGEVQYQVDGVTVNNPYDNTSTVRLDRSVLQEVQVISGTFDAEYGQALSGVVNAVLRSGDDDRYEFSAEVFAGDYVSPGNDSATVLTRTGQEVRVGRYPYIDDIAPTALQNYQFSFSGPVPLVPRTTFLINGQRNVDEGYLYGTRFFVPTDTSNLETGEFYPTGDGAVVPLEFERRWSFLAKVTNTSIRNVQLSYQAIGNSIDKRSYNHGYRFNPDATTTPHEFSLVHGLDITHVLSGRTFYEIGLRQNLFDFHEYQYEDANDPRYFEAGAPQSVFGGIVVQGLSLTRFVQRTNALVFKGALTSQVTNVHLLKAGLEFQRATLDFGVPDLLREVTINGIQQLGVVTDTVGAIVLHYTPVQGAAFVQDRIEWGDLRVRIGLRLEYFDANATVPSDLLNPANSIDGAPQSQDRPTTVKWALAPRLGVSFPILDRASMFFSYGHFYQMPGLNLLFNNADYSVLEDLQAGAVSYGILGNP
ncbi:MAG TPA: TonB-dependent receptor, partial [Rhodothermales bacterium]|nr:TonB-dependent receptor [Rhodothermales bacterium]